MIGTSLPMATVYILLNWALLFLYWLMIATVTIRILLKRRPVTSALTWLLIIYIIPLVGVIAYLAFGELHLGKRRVMKAKRMWPSVETWLENSNNQNIFFVKVTAEWLNLYLNSAKKTRNWRR